MSLRETFTGQPIVAIGAVVVILALAAWFAFGRDSGTTIEHGYYYNLDQGELIVDEVDRIPPFTTGDGHTAVVAAVFSCTDCGDAGSRFVGYLEKYSDELRKAMIDNSVIDPDVARNGHLIRSESGEKWIPSSSPEGQEIVDAVQQRCAQQQPQSCQP